MLPSIKEDEAAAARAGSCWLGGKSTTGAPRITFFDVYTRDDTANLEPRRRRRGGFNGVMVRRRTT